MRYVFRSENGCCPKCMAFGTLYYIQDRYIGSGKYEYALMSKPAEKMKSNHFKDEMEMISSLLGIVITDDIAAKLYLNQMTEYRCGNKRMLDISGERFIWDDIRKELKKYTEPKQETGYFDTYLECLNIAKEILKNREQENVGM